MCNYNQNFKQQVWLNVVSHLLARRCYTLCSSLRLHQYESFLAVESVFGALPFNVANTCRAYTIGLGGHCVDPGFSEGSVIYLFPPSQ